MRTVGEVYHLFLSDFPISESAKKMKPIPKMPVWFLVSETKAGEIRSIERFGKAEDANIELLKRQLKDRDLIYRVTEEEAIVPDRDLPTHDQYVEIGSFLHKAFVVLRFISYHEESFKPIQELTDVLHNLPVEMFDAEQWDWNFYIDALRNFEQQFPDVQTMNLAATLEPIRDGKTSGINPED